MAKGMYIGVDSKARKVKKMYVGVGGKARKVKKGYIGVGGKARLFFSSGPYQGEATAMSIARGDFAAANAGNYLLFAGGWTGGYYSDGYTVTNVVDAYNASLTRSTPTALTTARSELAGAWVGTSALFYGGYVSSSYHGERTWYNASLTKTQTSSTRWSCATGGSWSGKAIIAGGGERSSSPSDYLWKYDELGTTGSGSGMGYSAMFPAVATNSSYLVVAGGGGTSDSSKPIATAMGFNSSFTRTTATSLSVARAVPTGGTIGSYAVITGGHNSSDATAYKIVDAYNTSLTKTTADNMSYNHYWKHQCVTLNGLLIVYGGASGHVDCYDASLTHTIEDAPALSNANTRMAAGVIGDYGLFAGGLSGGSSSAMAFRNNVYIFKND